MGAMLPMSQTRSEEICMLMVLKIFRMNLCRKLRSILFPLTKDGELDFGTPADPNTLYESIIKAFESAIPGLETGA